MTRAAQRLVLLESFLPFAPRGVAALARGELQANPRLSAVERRGFQALIAIADGAGEQRTPNTFSCAFPVVLGCRPAVPAGLAGVVLTVHAGLGSTGGFRDAAPARRVFEECPEVVRIIGERLEAGGISLEVSPHPEDQREVRLNLRGPSAGGALYLAAAAAGEGLAVPADVVVSASLVEGPGGLWLGPVASCDAKRAILEVERPGCRFLFLPDPHEKVLPSDRIHLIPLAAVPVEDFFARVFGRRPSRGREQGLALLLEALDVGGRHFQQQHYQEARQNYDSALALLDARGDDRWHPAAAAWRWEVTARLAAIRMHSGGGDEVEPVFKRLGGAPPTQECCTRLLLVEVLTGLAGARIDTFDPEGAQQVLDRELAGLERLAGLGSLLSREDALVLIAIFGAQRRIHLLRGQPHQAAEVQRALLAVAPPRERPRALSDLGECLHRAGDDQGAVSTWNEAAQALAGQSEYYAHHTRGFLAFQRDRALLMSPEGPALAGTIAARAHETLFCLHPTSAATWRLQQLILLARLAGGESDALMTLASAAASEERAFVRWYRSLDLLRAAALAPHLASVAWGWAATLLEALAVPRYPALDEARTAFCRSVPDGDVDEGAVREIMRRRGY